MVFSTMRQKSGREGLSKFDLCKLEFAMGTLAEVESLSCNIAKSALPRDEWERIIKPCRNEFWGHPHIFA